MEDFKSFLQRHKWQLILLVIFFIAGWTLILGIDIYNTLHPELELKEIENQYLRYLELKK